MAKKKKSRRSDYITYLLFKAVLFGIRTAPKKLARSFCVALGKLFYKLDKKHRNITIDNLKQSFPEKSEEDILDISVKVFENLGATLFDFARMTRVNKSNYKDYYEYEGVEHVDDALRRKKGILFVSAHLCCWEQLSAHCFLYENTSVLAKDLHNEHVNRYIKRVRSDQNVLVMPVRHSVGQVIKLLRDGGTVYTLLDQYAHTHEAVNVDFFQREAATGYFAALLALKLDICVIPTFIKRVGDYKYKMYYLKPVDIINTGDRKKDLHDNTQTYTKVIEDEIRKRPEDWFWMHNRWKGT